jgi:hypothetical protein
MATPVVINLSHDLSLSKKIMLQLRNKISVGENYRGSSSKSLHDALSLLEALQALLRSPQ